MLRPVFAFAISAAIQQKIDAGLTPNIGWQILAYIVLTSAEVMVSITCLEFSYTQAPAKMKSFITAFFMMSIAIGNLFTSAVNFLKKNEDGTSKLGGADYFWFFCSLMLVTAILFVFVAKNYKEQSFLQDPAEDDANQPNRQPNTQP